MLPSDADLMRSLPELEAVVHLDEGELARFWYEGTAWCLSKLGVEPDRYKGFEQVLVPTMEVEIGDDPALSLREAMKPVSRHGKVTLVVRHENEFGFLTAPRLARYVPQPSTSWAQAMVGGPRQVSPFATEAPTCPC